jgi:hypothetical protein
MLTPYQFASNTPIQAIDLDGLEATLVVHEIGQNSITTYPVDLNDPDINPSLTTYADQNKYGTRGHLTVIKNLNSDDIIEIYEVSTIDWLLNKLDNLTSGNGNGTQPSGLALTSREGAGKMETRVFPKDGAKTVEISALLIYVNFTHVSKIN